jgi:hypothetical protein
MPEVVVYTLRWTDDHETKDGEIPNSQLHSRIFVDGEELKFATGITVEAKGNDFLTASISVLPSSVRFIEVASEDWKKDHPEEFVYSGIGAIAKT